MADCKNPTGGNSQKLSAAFPEQMKAGSNGLQINEVTNLVFDINSMLSAAQEYSVLNNALNKLIGYEVVWFRAVPQQRSQDVIFQEYTLSNVEDTPLCIKVVLPNGDFPDSKYNYDLMGLEYEVPLEVHIDKGYWEEMVGYGTAPQKKDIVYFAMPNKLYEVVSSYLFRGFLEQETTWKINLRKYQPQASRKEGDALKSTIDQYTVSAEELFGEKMESDIGKLVDKKQMSPFNQTSQDPYKILDKDLYVANSELNIYGIKVAESFYDLNTSRLFDAVIYNGIDQITTSTDRSITAWTMIDPGVVQEYNIEPLVHGGTYPANYIVTVKTKSQTFQIDQYMEIWRPGSLSFYAKIINDTGTADGQYQVQIDQPVIDHLNSIKSNWADQRNYKMKIQNPVSILDGINSTVNNGWRVDIHANQYIKINYGTQEYIAIATNKLLDKEWYGIIVNIGNTWGQYNVHIYGIHPTDVKTKLQSLFYETLRFTPEATTVDYYTINKGPSYLTNLRLYNYTIEEEKQMEDLLSYFVKDGDQLVIGDNADLRFRPPYTGKQK